MSRYILLRRPFLDSFWIRFWLYPNLGPNMLISRWFSHIFWRIGFLKFASIWGPCWSQHGPILHPKIDPNLLQESSQKPYKCWSTFWFSFTQFFNPSWAHIKPELGPEWAPETTPGPTGPCWPFPAASWTSVSGFGPSRPQLGALNTLPNPTLTLRLPNRPGPAERGGASWI